MNRYIERPQRTSVDCRNFEMAREMRRKLDAEESYREAKEEFKKAGLWQENV